MDRHHKRKISRPAEMKRDAENMRCDGEQAEAGKGEQFRNPLHEA
jgi:hypothetical protein